MDAHRRAIAIGDHQRLERFPAGQLSVRNQRVRSRRSIQRADRKVDVAPLNGEHDIVDADPQPLFERVAQIIGPLPLAYVHVIEGGSDRTVQGSLVNTPIRNGVQL